MVRDKKGFTLLELIVVAVIITILAAIAIPLAETSVKREKEVTLRRNLRMIRKSIDAYKEFVLKKKIKVEEDTYSYPPNLEILVKGIEYKNKKGEERIQKFLRKIPLDPMTNSIEWELRAYQDKPGSDNWGGDNVYDIYTKSRKTALDGSKYKDW